MHRQTLNILALEENPGEAAAIKAKLADARDFHFNVFAVGRLDKALARLSEGSIDLVIMGLVFPDSRGPDSFLQIHQRFPEVPVIILAGDDYADLSMAVRMLRQGAQDYIVKGKLSGGALADSIRSAIDRQYARTSGEVALQRLRELNESKSQFVAEVSHEIRTPLAIMREFAALVRDETAGPLNEKQKKCLDAILRNSDRLTELVNRILDLARIEAGKLELHKTKTDLADLLMQVRNDFMPVCQSKGQALIMDVPDNLPAAHCDVSSVQHVLTNLLGNAQKFTPRGGEIHIRAREESRFLRIEIEDNGPGIPEEAQAKIFEAFVQVDRKDGPGAKGTGLGLKIAKSLVEFNGGVISVTSTPGQGSCFSFTLPIYEEELPFRILIIDDDAAIVRLIEIALKHSDLKLEVQSSLRGFAALVMAGEFKPNLVILDIHLADVKGREVLFSLRQRNIKILAISGDLEALAEFAKDGADDYLAKPFMPGELLDKVRALLGVGPKKYLEPLEEQAAGAGRP